MDQQGMEEDDIALFHVQADSAVLKFLIILDTKVCLVHLSVPVRVVVVEEPPLVCLRKNVQTAVLLVAVLQGSPSSYYAVSWSEGEVGQVLVEGVSGAGAHAWWLIDEHGMDGLDVIPTEALEVRHQFRVGAVGLQNIIPLEILDLRDIGLSSQLELLVFLDERDITYNLHAGQSKQGSKYVGIFQSQQSRNLWRQASMSLSLRSFLTTMQPFSSQNLRCSSVRQPLSVVQRKCSVPPRSELTFERRSIMTQYLYNTRLGTLILMWTDSTIPTQLYQIQGNVKPFASRENNCLSLIFMEDYQNQKMEILYQIMADHGVYFKKINRRFSQAISYLTPSEIRASLIMINLCQLHAIKHLQEANSSLFLQRGMQSNSNLINYLSQPNLKEDFFGSLYLISLF